MAGNPLRVVIFTSVPPRQVARILARIRRDASEAHVAGVLYERRPPKTLQQRMGIWRKKLKRLLYWRYVLHRVLAAAAATLSGCWMRSSVAFMRLRSGPTANPDMGLTIWPRPPKPMELKSSLPAIFTPPMHSTLLSASTAILA